MSNEEMLVLSWWDDMDEYMAVGYKGLENHTKLTKEQLKPIIASLKEKGYLLYEKTLVDDEGIPAGSGWSRTEAGSDAYYEQKEATQPKPNTMGDLEKEIRDDLCDWNNPSKLGTYSLEDNVKKVERLITAKLKEVENKAVHKFITEMPDGVYNKKGKSIVMIDLASLKGGDDEN